MNRFSMEEFGYRKISILIVDDNSPFVLPLLRSFSGFQNIRVDVLLSSDRKANHFRYSRFLGDLEIVNELTDENIVSIIEHTVNKFDSDLIIPTREWLSVLLFRHKSELEKCVMLHPLPEPSILEITGNKWNLNEWLKKNGFPFALTCRIGNGWDRDYPVLLKPVFGIGGKGIHIIHSPNELRKLTINLNDLQKNYFLQELIKGDDIDVSFFAVDGEIIYHTIQRGLISGKMIFSKGIEFVKNKELLKLVSEMVELLKYTGIGHLDFRFNSEKNEYFLIDFNARYWSSIQGSRAMGVNFPLLVTSWMFTKEVVPLDPRTGHYYFSTAALKTILRNLFSTPKYPVKIKDTQLLYNYKDPLPELMYLVNRVVKTYKY